jgi:hypothetical protein
MTYQDERKPIQPVEVSQKYMAWNIKEISESLKAISQWLELLVKAQLQKRASNSPPERASNSPPIHTMHDRNEELPF